MFSQAGKIYQRSRQIKPFSKDKREQIYRKQKVNINEKKFVEKKQLPFNTISRIKRDSYLLRVTNEPNTQTNYWANYSLIHKNQSKPTIDKAYFKRIIGDVNDKDYSIKLKSDCNHKCLNANKSLLQSQQRPLTVKDCHKWRKTFTNIDFSKQTSYKNSNDFQKKDLQQTNTDLMRNLKEITQSNFNNYRRFSLKSSKQKSHNFISDIGHKYLDEIQKKQKMPQYDITCGDQSIIIKSATKVKGWPLFPLYRQKVITKYDNSDINWNTLLSYQNTNLQTKNKTISFNKTTNRLSNTIYSKYPIRLSLSEVSNLKSSFS